jgi:glycyl-tRNA synthetase
MTFLVDAYTEDEAPNTKGGVDKRVVLRLDPRLAPVKAAVLPLRAATRQLSPKAQATSRRRELRKHHGDWNIDFDDHSRRDRPRYRRQDEIGTPFSASPSTSTPSTTRP